MMKNSNDGAGTQDTDDTHALSISALMDGALSGQEVDDALAAATRPQGQERWRTYHLIGDAMRSPGLAAGLAAGLTAPHDAALLANVRAAIGQTPMLAREAAPLPGASGRQAANDGVFRWKLASGFASVVAVAAIGWNAWGLLGSPPGQQLARQDQAHAQPLVVASATTTGVAAHETALDAQHLALNTSARDDDARMLRDPQLDRLLAAHRGMAAFGGSPSAFLRSATFEEPEH